MPTIPENQLFEYAIVRYLPKVEREEFINVGLVMMCKRQKWIRARVRLSEAKARIFSATDDDIADARAQLTAFSRIAEGTGGGAIAGLDPHERFRWLTAVRSACIATSRPHCGKTDDLDGTFERIYHEMVL